MIQIPDEVKKLFLDDNIREQNKRKLKLRFYDRVEVLYPSDTLFPDDRLFPDDTEPWVTINHDRIVSESLELIDSICDSTDIIFGSCTSSQCKITVADVPEDVTGKEFLLSVEIGGYEIAMGIYRVESFERLADRRLKTITAYDRMRSFHTDVAVWYRGLTFPMPLKKFRDSLCAYVGVEQVNEELIFDDMIIKKTIEPETLSGLDVIQKICEINGVFGQFGRSGYLKYASLAITSLWPSETLYPEDTLFPTEATEYAAVPHYKKLVYEDYLVSAIDRIQIRMEEGGIGVGVGEGSNSYTVEGNFLLYGRPTTELMIIARGMYDQIGNRVYRPCILECPAMPWVEAGDCFHVQTNTDLIESFVLKRTMKGIQAMMDTFEAAGSETREENFGIGSQIIQLQGKTAVIKKSVEEVSVTVSDLKEYTEAQVKIMSDQILMKVSKGDVSSQLSIEPDKITLAGNRLIVQSTNFQLDGDGNATFSGLVSGASIRGGTINIGNGTFVVERDGSVNLESGEINIGPVSINDSIVDFGNFRVAAGNYGALYSKNLGIELWDKNFNWNNMPTILIGGESGTVLNPKAVKTPVVRCNDVFAKGCALAQGDTRLWGLGETIDWMWNELNKR